MEGTGGVVGDLEPMLTMDGLTFKLTAWTASSLTMADAMLDRAKLGAILFLVGKSSSDRSVNVESRRSPGMKRILSSLEESMLLVGIGTGGTRVFGVAALEVLCLLVTPGI